MATHDNQERLWIGAPTHRRLKAWAKRNNQVMWELATVWLRERLDVEAAERKARRKGGV